MIEMDFPDVTPKSSSEVVTNHFNSQQVDIKPLKDMIQKKLPRSHPLRKVIELEDDLIPISEYYYHGLMWLKLAGSK